MAGMNEMEQGMAARFMDDNDEYYDDMYYDDDI